MKGGGTPYLEPLSPGSYESSIGVFGGLGGGGGPGFDTDVECIRAVGLLFVCAYLPAPSYGGGAANLGGGGPLGGEGSRGGVGSLGAGSVFVADLLAGGGAGGAPRPRPAGTFCGLSDLVCEGATGGGGGGGALFLWFSIPFGEDRMCTACC